MFDFGKVVKEIGLVPSNGNNQLVILGEDIEWSLIIAYSDCRFQENTILSIPTRLFPSLLTRKCRWQSPTYLSSLSRHSWLSWAALWVSGSVWGLSSCSVGASLRPPGSDLNIGIQCKKLKWFCSVLLNKW